MIDNKRRMVAYGAGNAYFGLCETKKWRFEFLIDDRPELTGLNLSSVLVISLEEFARIRTEDILVVICANTPAGVLGIAHKLIKIGLRPNVDFIDCSRLQFHTIPSRFHGDWKVQPSENRLNLVRALSLSMRPKNLSSIAGTWLLLELLESIPSLANGEVAECGVYQGANALILATLSETISRRAFNLFDSFEGLASLSSADPKSRQGEFSDVSVEEIDLLFSAFRNVRIVKGRFEESLPKDGDFPYVFAYVDCDLYEGTATCCRYFWPKIPPGGFLVTHDYWFPDVVLPGGRDPFLGVKRAFDEFSEEVGVKPVAVPETSHAILRKQ